DSLLVRLTLARVEGGPHVALPFCAQRAAAPWRPIAVSRWADRFRARAWPPNAPRATAAACVCFARVVADPAAAPGCRGLRRWRPTEGRYRGVSLARLLMGILASHYRRVVSGRQCLAVGPAEANQTFRKRVGARRVRVPRRSIHASQAPRAALLGERF